MAADTRKRTGSQKNRVTNGGFEERLSAWGSEGAQALSAESGQLVHTGTHAVILSRTNAFVSQTVYAGRGARLQFSAHIRGVQNLANSPLVVRLRWVDASGSFIGTALEIFVAQKQLSATSWLFLWDYTNLAPSGTAGVNVRIDAPYAEGEAAIVVDDIAVR